MKLDFIYRIPKKIRAFVYFLVMWGITGGVHWQE